MMLVFIGLAVLYMYSDSVTIVLRTVTFQVPSDKSLRKCQTTARLFRLLSLTSPPQVIQAATGHRQSASRPQAN